LNTVAIMNIFAPEIDNIIGRYSRCRDLSDRGISPKLKAIFEAMSGIRPDPDTDVRTIWMDVPRGTIEDFGDYRDYLDEGEVESYEEFENLWKDLYPEETKWYSFSVSKYKEEIYFTVNSELCVTGRENEQADKASSYAGQDLYSFIDQALFQITMVTGAIQADCAGYNDYLEKNLSHNKRFARIKRNDFWEIFGNDAIRADRNLGDEIIGKLSEIVTRQNEPGYDPLIHTMTAGDFFRYCAICYDANQYFKDPDLPLTPKDKYARMADGRDAGLKRLEGDSPQAFLEWYLSGERTGAHPWEICRGGNSTHISLYVHRQDPFWKLILDGSSIIRVEETVRMAVSLSEHRIPFVLRDSEAILRMVTGNDYIGIVPDYLFPRYCHGYFPKEDRIIDFMNLGHENTGAIIEKAFWYPLKRIEVIQVSGWRR